MNERTSRFKALEFLCSNNLCTLSTSAADTPESSLLYYVVDDKFYLFMITTRESRKVKNLLQNNKISLVIYSEIPPLELQIDGEAERVDDQTKKEHIAKIYLEMAAKNPETKNWPPVIRLPNTEGFEFIKVKILKFKYSDFRTPDNFIVEGTPLDWN